MTACCRHPLVFMQRIFLIFALIFSLFCSVKAQERTDSIPPVDNDGGPLTVSVITCAPGPDVYELCGHTAIRIRNEKMDSVWNYGIFDFTSPNFLYRFCKGQTDYMVCGYQFGRFMPAYVRRGSKVSEQVLNLTQEEARSLRKLLQTESLPQNRVYRYNYVLDNCATRPWKRVNEATDREIATPDTSYFNTFRDEMKHFHRNYPWYQFGIDLALGRGIDRKLNKDEDTFAPLVLSEKLATTTIGGESLVKTTNVIFPGYADATLPPTLWYLTPMSVGILMLLASVAVLILACKFNLQTRSWLKLACNLWISLYFTIAGIAGCVIVFLVFCSEHEATSPNWLMLWLNPLQFILAAGVWFRSRHAAVSFMAKYNIVIPIFMTAMWCVQWLALNTSLFGENAFVFQAINPAVVPMFVSAIPLALATLSETGVLKLKKKDK